MLKKTKEEIFYTTLFEVGFDVC